MLSSTPYYTSTIMQAPNSESLTTLPLFPLNVVLFPGMPLPLHIFEERYKAMIGNCIDRQAPFGVVLIKEGKEVGDPAEPFHIGTAARILKVQHLDEGKLSVLTSGERRFEIIELTQHLPHLEGQVRYLDEEVGAPPGAVLPQVQEEYTQFARTVASFSGSWNAPVELPDDPVLLSFLVASNLDLPKPIRQLLLELPTATERLERLVPLLQRLNVLMREERAKRSPYQGPRLN